MVPAADTNRVSRPAASVVVTAGGTPADFHACLDSLLPGLGARDEVVCVLPAHRADLRGVLQGRTRVTVVEDDSGDQATRWSAGCAATSRPVVVLLDGDVVLSSHWLDPVLEALADPAVVAAGPRCHLSPGPQGAALPAVAVASVRAFKAYARQWRQDRAGRFTDVELLGPICVAIRRDALERAGGLSGQLSFDRLRAGGRLVIAEAALVGHVASELCALATVVPDDAPLLSACMIVKDEEAVLADSLSAVLAFADEVVVYDTGSTDRTRDIARELGVTVVEGYWDDHFGDARNRAVGHCAGRWVLTVDADEVITGDPAELRRSLASAHTDVGAFFIGVESMTGYGTGVFGRQLSARLARRARLTYAGRIHEQGVDRVTGARLTSAEIPGVTLLHSGYTVMRAALKNKGERNVRLSLLAVEDGHEGPWARVNLARSQMLDGDFAAVVETCRKGLTDTPREFHPRFLQPMIQAYQASGQLEKAREAVEQLRELDQRSAAGMELDARLRVLEGDFTGALEVIAAIPSGGLDDLLVTVDESRTVEIEIVALAGLGRHHEAAERLRDSVRKGWIPCTLTKIADILAADGSAIPELAELLPRASMRGLLLAATEAPDDLADDVCEALWQTGGAPMILAGAARVAARLPLMRAMEWSARMREHGLAEHCTLVALASNQARTARDRVLAAAIALELFAEERATQLLEEALGEIPDSENDSVLDELRQLSPTIASSIVPVGVA